MATTDSPTPDPSDVHPEHDRPLPSNVDDWSEEQLDRYNRLKERQLGADLASDRVAEREEHDAAAAMLVDAATEGAETAEIDIFDGITDGEQPVTVKTYVPGEVERRLAAMESLEKSVDALVFALTTMIEGPEPYDRPALWQRVYEDGGSIVLGDYLDNVLAPAGAVDSFREE